MPFSVTTLIRDEGTLGSLSIWVFSLVVIQASLLRASREGGRGHLQFVMHVLDLLHRARGLFGLALEVSARGLAGDQHDAVVADHDDVRVLVQGRIGLGDVHRGLGLDQRVVDLAADGSGPAIVVDRFVPGGAEETAAASQGQAQGQGGGDEGGTAHSSLPNSWRSIGSQRQWMASRWTSWMRAVILEGTRISTSSGSSSHAATVAAGQGDNQHLAVVGSLDGLDHVGRIAAGGNRQQDVARLAQGADLLEKTSL